MDRLFIQNNILDKRENDMGGKQNGKVIPIKEANDSGYTHEKNDRGFQIILSVVSPIVVAFLLFIAGWIWGIFKLPDKVESIEKNIGKIDTNIEIINSDIESERGRIDNIFTTMALSNTKVIYPTDVATSALPNEIEEFKLETYASAPIWSSSGIVAKELKSGREYNAEELVGKKILIPYKENNQEVYFWGQYNEKLQWDGDCLINVYLDGNLIISSLGTFDNGNRVKYEQIFVEDSEWIYAKRVTDGQINSGDTWKYDKTVNYSQKIAFENPSEDDMVRPDILNNVLNERLIARYHGSTSNGKYNDESGNAYFIAFNDDNSVRTLYHGNFKDGKFSDKTGNAWYITCAENTDYMYFMGEFENNTALKNGEYYFENPVKRETLDRKVNLNYYDCVINFNENKISENGN